MKKHVFLGLVLIFFAGFISAQSKHPNYKKASREFEFQRYHNAVPLFEDILTSEPENASVLFKLGVCYFRISSQAKALEFVEKAHKIDKKVDKYSKKIN